MGEKSRFMRLLDLSLRSPKLPSKMICSFLKRIFRVMVSDGVISGSKDILFVAAFTANTIRRHPRCLRLVHRKKASISMNLTLTSDPFKH